jgi:hypothetical protein
VAAVLVSLALIVVAAALLVLITYYEHRPRPLESAGLRFGRDVTVEAVEAVLSRLSGLPGRSPVVFEVVGNKGGIRHRLHAEPAVLDAFKSQVRAVLPSVRFDPLPPAAAMKWRHAWRLRWTSPHPVLQTEQPAETAAGLLAAFSSLEDSEALRLLWIVAPTHRPALPRREGSGGTEMPALARWIDRQPSPEQLRLLRRKYDEPILSGRAVVMAKGSDRLFRRVQAVLRSRRTSFGRLSVRSQKPAALSRLAVGFHQASRLSPSELTGLIGWPIDAPRVPGLSLSSAPQLMPAPDSPRTGRVFARSDWPGLEDRMLAQPIVGGLSHALVVGPTGSGKSHLLASLAGQDIEAGRGCFVFDGKGDLASEVLARIPERRQDEVIVLDPSSRLPLPGLRVFTPGSDPELTADLVLGIFRELFADSWGIRSDKWLRAGLVTLALDEGATLASLPLLFNDDGYRRQLVSKVRDPLLADTWAAFEAMSPRDRLHQLGSPLSKVSEVVGRRVVRAVLAQPQPKLDMREVLASNKIVVVSLSPGRIGTPAARLIGAVVFHRFFAAVQARGALASHARRPFFVYVDEPKVLADMPVPLDSIFEMARGLGVGLTLGAQSLTQLPKAVSTAALTNAATICAFKQSADDAAILSRELLALTAEELQGLGAFEVAVRLGLGPGKVAPVATGVTLPLPKPSSSPRAVARASAERYGVPLAEVDKALRLRRRSAQSPAALEVPVGRTRRPS